LNNVNVPPPPRLYIITDRTVTGGRPFFPLIERALEGITETGLWGDEVAVQLREKDLATVILAHMAEQLRRITAKAGVRLYINDRIDVAIAVDADGVHLSGTSLSPAEARAMAPAMGIGVSAHSITEVHAAAAHASFAVFGPIRDTPSKRAYGPPLGFDALAEAARLDFPLLALGGLDARDVPEALSAGAHGVACIRPVMAATDPADAVRGLCRALARAHGRPL
jgi:thiamine-phosphate pyrophosphorylase